MQTFNSLSVILQNLAGQSDLVDQATNAIYDTKDKTDRLTALRENAESLQRAVQRNVNKLAGVFVYGKIAKGPRPKLV